MEHISTTVIHDQWYRCSFLALIVLSRCFQLVILLILFPRICPQLATLDLEVFVVGFYVSGPFVRKKFVQRDFLFIIEGFYVSLVFYSTKAGSI